jgi:hypothetical protein
MTGKTLFARAENEPRHTDGQSRHSLPDQSFCGFPKQTVLGVRAD